MRRSNRHDTWNSSVPIKWDRYIDDDDLDEVFDDETHDTRKGLSKMTKFIRSLLALVFLSSGYGALLFGATQILGATSVGYWDAVLLAGAFVLFRVSDLSIAKIVRNAE